MSDIKLKCVVIDDEPMALDLIKSYVEKTQFLELLGAYHNPIEALSFVQTNEVDLVYIDINMPGITGLQFIKSLQNNLLYVLTTAYSEFAVESYTLNVVDYLLKPIEFDRFLNATTKALHLFKLNNPKKIISNIEHIPGFIKPKSIKVKSGNKIYQIQTSEIRYIQGSGNYVTIHTLAEKIMTLYNMNDITKLLPKDDFTRVHKSFIVALKHIDVVESHKITLNSVSIPIGQTYRNDFFKVFHDE